MIGYLKKGSHNANRILVVILFAGLFYSLNAQVDTIRLANALLSDRGEIYFAFERNTYGSLPFYSNLLYIDRITVDSIFAYANKKQFDQFLELKIPFTILTPPSLNFKVKSKLAPMEDWTEYPSYTRYIQMMENFEVNYPQLCSLIELGESGGGRKILAVRLSGGLTADGEEPEVFYSAGIHGDEGSGVLLLLRLIDYLVSNYGSNEKVTDLLNHISLYINPLSNPDGFYFLSDTTHYGSKRTNLQNIDLNRNFPDPEDGDHPYGEPWQVETLAMMNFMKQHHFVLSANFHDGEEVVNYPWDTFINLHPDDSWFRALSRAYADTAHAYAGNGYMTFLDNGITNGYQWYPVSGGRQDYITGFLQGREVTIELSYEKSPAGATLLKLWEYNLQSLLNYPLFALQGIKGQITDSKTGTPLHAHISITGYDDKFSEVTSDENSGIFFRLLNPGNYSFQITANGYQTVLKNVVVSENQFTIVNSVLEPVKDNEFRLIRNPLSMNIQVNVPDSVHEDALFHIFDVSGRKVCSGKMFFDGPGITSIHLDELPNGIYILKISGHTLNKTIKIELY